MALNTYSIAKSLNQLNVNKQDKSGTLTLPGSSGNSGSQYTTIINPTKASNGSTININTILDSTTTTPIPANAPSNQITITRSDGSTYTSSIQNLVIFTDESGTVFCSFDLPANSNIYLDAQIGINSSESLASTMKRNITLFVRDTTGRTNNMWINSEGVATVSRSSISGKRLGVFNDGDTTNTFLLIAN